ncbi:MAG TPA: hypothetical protein VI932_10975 [Bacteroidota bacterium]|nr:hypothetical protein [Bacteroidota bacterium]
MIASAWSQPPGDNFRAGGGPADSSNGARILFDKIFSTYRWQGLLLYGGGTPGFRYDIGQNFRSTLIRTNTNLITDEETFRASFRHGPGDRIEPSAAMSAYVLSDRRGLGLSDVSSYSVHAGAAWRPSGVLTIEPLAGYRADRQSDRTDRGISYLLRMEADTFDYAGYVSGFDGAWEYNRLDPRTIETRRAQLTSRKSFPGDSRNTFELRYYRNRRDFYTPADADVMTEFGVDRNIETRAEDMFSVRDSLLYNVTPGFSLAVNAGVLSRGIGRESKYKSYADPGRPLLNSAVDELTIGGEFIAAWAVSASLDGRFALVLQERSETHQAERDDGYHETAVDSLRRIQERKNSVGKRTSMALALDVRLSPSHRVSVSASGTILRYDTPSILNTDDRDDLWYLASVTSRHRLSRYLSLTLSADASLTHLVYLSSARSADNTWNRILRLSPHATWTPFRFLVTSNRFEVLANYTVYDFDTPGAGVRSFAFRQFALADSTVWSLTKRASVEWNSHVRLYERGNLRWDDFSERPVSYFEDFTHIGTVRYAATPLLIFSLGIRYFSQMRFDYAGNRRVPQQFLRSVGPATGIEWSVSSRTALTVKGWYERQSRTGLPDHGIANVTMSLNVSL